MPPSPVMRPLLSDGPPTPPWGRARVGRIGGILGNCYPPALGVRGAVRFFWGGGRDVVERLTIIAGGEVPPSPSEPRFHSGKKRNLPKEKLVWTNGYVQTVRFRHPPLPPFLAFNASLGGRSWGGQGFNSGGGGAEEQPPPPPPAHCT